MGQFLETMIGFVRWSLGNPLSYLVLGAAVWIAVTKGPTIGRGMGWSPGGTRLAIIGLAVALVPTLVVRIGTRPSQWDPAAVVACGWGITQPWVEPLEILNLLLMVPLAAGLVWASRRPAMAVLIAVVVAVLLEPTQAILGLGQCDAEDTARYVIGAVAAVAAMFAALKVAAHKRQALATPPLSAGQPQVGGVHD